MAKKQPDWLPPSKNNQPVLKLYNSLTRQKEEFIPKNGNQVLWYSCGPTVYDVSHMGHARSYISFDILRRVLTDYFSYDVCYVMNITDIDDKIIKRARQAHLYSNYMDYSENLSTVISVFHKFFMAQQNKGKPLKDEGGYVINWHLLAGTFGANARQRSSDSIVPIEIEEILLRYGDSFKEYLDEIEGANVSGNALFLDFPAIFEYSFLEDMASLNILPPNVLTRVSEYVPEIVEYIQKIIKNKLAYESNGSVYFDVAAFDALPNHHYAKLVPEAYGDSQSLQEGEGDLFISEDRLSEKKSPNDFALWKNSKPGEPRWSSPWGNGRPGWHIECSVMASAICGSSIDIHTGGVDLKFPHHDNELAQAEAYFGNDDWVKYFLHSGHLTISGCKMSKSLKNFITIKDALTEYSGRQLRLAFLLHSWKDTLDYSTNTMEMAVQYEKFVNEFFLNIKALIRDPQDKSNYHNFKKLSSTDINLNNKFIECKLQVHAALCDNVDTRSVLDFIREMVSASNVYLRDESSPNLRILKDIAGYITKMFKIFGVITVDDDIGFPISADTESANLHFQLEERIMPCLNALAVFRRNVRTAALHLKARDILIECDRLRDDILPDLGIRLEDQEGRPSVIKLVDRETFLKEKEAKKKLEVAKHADKLRKKAEQLAIEVQKEVQRKIPPETMFLHEVDKYSRFDDKGIPTHDYDGKPVSKGLRKKLQKLQQTQKKKYEDYLATKEDS